MTSQRPHLNNFDENFIFSEMENWKATAERYDHAARQHYKKIRSYLTFYQFRLSDGQKCEIREKLAQCLDEICSHDFVHDLDSYLEGFCFTLDKSVIRTQPKEVKIQIQPKAETNPEITPVSHKFSDPTLDYADLDYYTMQFFE